LFLQHFTILLKIEKIRPVNPASFIKSYNVSKKVSGRQTQSICTFKEMLNEKTVNAWDKSLERWFAFNIDDLEKFGIVVKKF